MMKLEGLPVSYVVTAALYTGRMITDGQSVRDNGDNIVLNRDPQSGVLGRSALKTVPLIFGRESERFEPDGNDPALLRSFGEIVAPAQPEGPATYPYYQQKRCR